MEIYNDEKLNTLANDVRDEIEELSNIMGRMMGYDKPVDPEAAKNFAEKMENTPAAYANNFLRSNKKKLSKIEEKVGKNDDAFKELSNGLAIAVIGILKIPINMAKVYTTTSDFEDNLEAPETLEIKRKISGASITLIQLRELDTEPTVKSQINALQNTVRIVEKKFDSSAGCYIATFVYGSYDSYEVTKLRLFRDEKLSHSFIGRFFINFYYIISPILVNHFSGNRFFKKVSKILIEKLIRFLRL